VGAESVESSRRTDTWSGAPPAWERRAHGWVAASAGIMMETSDAVNVSFRRLFMSWAWALGDPGGGPENPVSDLRFLVAGRWTFSLFSSGLSLTQDVGQCMLREREDWGIGEECGNRGGPLYRIEL
jgi:hypothetical protein